jgi:glycosyltransferase involved in cell wall biosynthesis
MIKVDKIETGLPVSVIIPLSKHREEFFYNMVLPLLEANNVNEIIINTNEGSAPKKRNEGFDASTQPYVFFCDDDILLPANYIESLYKELIKNKDITFTYTGYVGVVLNPSTHPMRGNFKIPHIEFNIPQLKHANYISTMSLLKREYFPYFDIKLKRLQDYDLWLTVVKNGGIGKLVKDKTFYAFYLDDGITSIQNNEVDAILAIRDKHSL